MLIAVQDLSMGGWQAGSVVSRTIALSLSRAGESVVYACREPQLAPYGLNVLGVQTKKPLPGENTIRRILRLPSDNGTAAALRDAGASVVLPMVLPSRFPKPPSIGWIPDFQHKHLPELFSPGQRRDLDARFERLGAASALMWFSSEDAAGDFRTGFPQFAQKARVASFPSLFAYQPPKADPRAALAHYGLPEKFLVVINQFWKHKNHRIVAEALGILRRGGLRVPAVMAGLPADYRDRENSSLSETLQLLARSGAWGDCVVLGKIPRAEIEALLQSASALIQPSRFEGWNTSVEDAKALGCPVIASDIAVHREQCPDALGFFGCDDAASLAELIARAWPALPPRPDHGAVEKSLKVAAERGAEFGRAMAGFCREAAA